MKNHSLLEFDCRLSRMRVAAAVVGGIGVAGAVTSGISSHNAANAQQQAAQQAYNGEQNYMQQNTQNYSPYMNAGSTAINQISQDEQNGTGFAQQFSLGNFMSDPGYQFQLQQGQGAINNSAAATGGVLNGGTEKALAQYTSGLANTTYGDAYNRYLENSQNQYNQLSGTAGMGLSATTSLGAQNGNAQTAAGNDLTQKGNAQAAGDIGVGNAINSGLGSIAGAYGASNMASLASAGSQSGYGSLGTSGTNDPAYLFNQFGGNS